MDATFVALLRGINVGKAKRIAMADLRSLVEELGYQNVRTLLNSGNVVFTRPGKSRTAPGPRIQQAIADRLGVTSRVLVLSADELSSIIAENPLLEVADDPSRLIVTVCFQSTDIERLQKLAQEDWSPDVLALGDRTAYVWCAEGILASKLAVAVGKVLGDAGTSRNWATMCKLQSLVQAPK